MGFVFFMICVLVGGSLFLTFFFVKSCVNDFFFLVFLGFGVDFGLDLRRVFVVL